MKQNLYSTLIYDIFFHIMVQIQIRGPRKSNFRSLLQKLSQMLWLCCALFSKQTHLSKAP